MMEDNEDRWFEGLEDDFPRSSGCGACTSESTTRRHRGRLCLGSRAKALTLQERHRRFVGDSAFRRSFRGDGPGKVANPARRQLNRENIIPLSPFAPENLVSRDGFGRPVPHQPAHQSFSTLRLNLVLTHGIRPAFRGGVHLFI